MLDIWGVSGGSVQPVRASVWARVWTLVWGAGHGRRRATPGDAVVRYRHLGGNLGCGDRPAGHSLADGRGSFWDVQPQSIRVTGARIAEW